jgi:exodeoxyribonuclease VII small subunit
MIKELPLTYQEATEEVEKILTQMENNTLDVDGMTEAVKKALSLLSYCNQKLRKTEEEIMPLISNEI